MKFINRENCNPDLMVQKRNNIISSELWACASDGLPPVLILPGSVGAGLINLSEHCNLITYMYIQNLLNQYSDMDSFGAVC